MSYKQVPIIGPWGGIVDNIGRPNAPMNVFDDCVNWMTVKGRLQTRPKLTTYGSNSDGDPIYYLKTFRDLNNNYHNLALSSKKAYAITAGPVFNALSFPTGVTTLGNLAHPFGVALINRRVYFCSGGSPLLYTDGSSALKLAGDVPGGARYLGVLAQHLIEVYCEERGGRTWTDLVIDGTTNTKISSSLNPFTTADVGTTLSITSGTGFTVQWVTISSVLAGVATCSLVVGTTSSTGGHGYNITDYPSRVRWSKSNDPNNYSDYSAGFNDIIDVSDSLTGYALSGTNGLLFRSDGITAMIPTGIGISPFAFENFSMEPRGAGNFYPYSLATYGSRIILFIAEDDIYRIDGAQVSPVGGSLKKSIFADIAAATGTITGQIIPNLGVGLDYLSYWLVIPKDGETKVWVLQLDDNTWTRFSSSTGVLTSLGSVFTS